MKGKISRERKEQIVKAIRFVLLSGMILIVISQGVSGVCYCLGKYNLSRPEMKVLRNLDMSSGTLYGNGVNGILVKRR